MRRSSRARVLTREPARGSCSHRWLLETPNGPRVQGRCRVCGAERDFPTTAGDLWYGEPWSDFRTRERERRAGYDPQDSAA